jgi:sodium pump decarboxylase gamma subunit
MTILEMLEQSALLAIFGMAIVFLFLWIMIVCVNLTGNLIHKMGWDAPALEAARPIPTIFHYSLSIFHSPEGKARPLLKLLVRGGFLVYGEKSSNIG